MFTLKAPAKINWLLSVKYKRDDGYHEITSLMQCVSLYDYLSFETSDEDNIKIMTDSGISPEENLVYKAAKLLKEQMSVKNGATITLKKEIPLSAGLGGGSSDAACALTGLNKLWNLGLKKEELSELGGTLGSDIPFFFNAPFAKVEGRGEVVTQIVAKIPYAVLLVNPGIGISSKWAYTEISGLLTKIPKSDDNIQLFCQALDKQDFKTISLMLKNDLEAPVIMRHKVIKDIKDKMISAGARASLMSGSGSTVFGVFDDKEKALKAADAMKPNWFRVVETLTAVDSEGWK